MDELDGHVAHTEHDNSIQIFGLKPEGKRPCGNPGHRGDGNIKMVLSTI